MKENKGFSLVELIIVLAIVAVLGGIAIYSLSLLTGQHARECANNTSAALDKEKNYALTRSATVDCYIEIVMRDGEGYFARYYIPGSAITQTDWVLAEEQKLGRQRVSVIAALVSTDTGAIQNVTIDTDTSIKIVYDRTSGAFKGTVLSDGTDGDAGNLPDTDTIAGNQCTAITIDQGRTYEIELYPATGKHVLSRLN